MHRTTLDTHPFSHSQSFQPARAAACSARRTGYGTVPLRNDFDVSPKPHGFVQELLPQHRPTSILNRFRHSGFAELGRADISYDDMRVVSNQSSRDLVQEIL